MTHPDLATADDTDPERLDLAARITAAAPSWGIWKNVRSALSGSGDIDSVVQPGESAAVEQAFAAWASERGYLPFLRCDHAGDLMRILVAIDRRSGTLIELDLTARKTWRGSTIFTVADIEPTLELDERGYRRIRPGAEAILLLFHNGMSRWGAPLPGQIERRGIAAALSADPDGARLATTLFGSTAGAAWRLSRAVAAGRWDRAAAMAVVLRSSLRAVLEPVGVAQRVWFRAVTKKRCPVVRVAYAPGRRLPAEQDAWIAAAVAMHEPIEHP